MTVSKCVSVVDAGVEKCIANHLLRGKTLDKAVFMACKQSPELYAHSLVDAPHTPEGAETKGAGRRGKKEPRTPDEERAAAKRQTEQLQRQVENLKNGKFHKPAKGGGRPGDNGKGKGDPNRPYCPDNVCKEFNFKVGGCTHMPGCKLQHRCCVCGQNHPFTGNH